MLTHKNSIFIHRIDDLGTRLCCERREEKKNKNTTDEILIESVKKKSSQDINHMN